MVSMVLLFFATIGAMLLFFEGGLWLGRWRAQRPDPEPPLSARTIVAGVMRLLAFLLAFTFGLAASHFDARNDAFDDEAAAIATAYSRTDLISEPGRSELHALLREYVTRRLEVANSANVAEAIAELRRLQEKMWARTVAAQGDSTIPPIVFQALNDVGNRSEQVLKKMESRIPAPVWVGLYVITFIAVAAAGYLSGICGAQRRSISVIAYALTFSAVLVMIVDADNPAIGQLRANRQVLVELHTRLTGEP